MKTVFLGASLIGLMLQTGFGPVQKTHRVMKGIYIVGHEIEMFAECVSKITLCEVYNVEPENQCWLEYGNEAANVIQSALKKERLLDSASRAFKITIVGSRIKTPNGSGHMGAYFCKVSAKKVISVEPAEILPPEINPNN
jgi:hypothetical protein